MEPKSKIISRNEALRILLTVPVLAVLEHLQALTITTVARQFPRAVFGATKACLFAQECYDFKENLRAQYADRIWQIRKAYLDENPNRQSLLALNISRISPTAVYYNAAAILAETDLGSFWRFMEQARQYRREWVEYLRDEKIFSSRRWFTTEFEEPFDLSKNTQI